ncbi:MAG: hypothetical protein K0R92_3557 [Lachnospiraceae bacterium]|nr:hypothetical protein [Lachnospiraceae bacterium]
MDVQLKIQQNFFEINNYKVKSILRSFIYIILLEVYVYEKEISM